MTPAALKGFSSGVSSLRVDLQHLKTEIEPLAVAHGVELVALEWLQGPGRGVLRIYIDRAGGDPRTAAAEREHGMTADLCAAVSRDVSAALDVDEALIDMPYDLEVSSPGFERPVQKRADFDRFAGLVVKLKARTAIEGKGSLEGVLVGTTDRPAAVGGFAVKLTVGARALEVDVRDIARARLAEIKAPATKKSPRAPGPRSGKAAKQPEGARTPRSHDDTTPTRVSATAPKP
jgi:ribosome maturation factor RimP